MSGRPRLRREDDAPGIDPVGRATECENIAKAREMAERCPNGETITLGEGDDHRGLVAALKGNQDFTAWNGRLGGRMVWAFTRIREAAR